MRVRTLLQLLDAGQAADIGQHLRWGLSDLDELLLHLDLVHRGHEALLGVHLCHHLLLLLDRRCRLEMTEVVVPFLLQRVVVILHVGLDDVGDLVQEGQQVVHILMLKDRAVALVDCLHHRHYVPELHLPHALLPPIRKLVKVDLVALVFVHFDHSVVQLLG